MSKKNKTNNIPPALLERMDNYLQKHDMMFFWIIFGITLLVSLGLYDPRVSLTGDDSSYILRADNFLKSFAFPDFQGPLYPVVLSLVVACFGISLLPLKLFSLVSMLAFMYFTFITFRKKIPHTLLFSVLLLTSINSYILYYASQTYSEAFYMFMQSVVFFVFCRFFIAAEGDPIKLGSFIKRHLWLALAVVGLALSRSVGFSMIIAVAGYFVFYKKWKDLGAFLVCFGVLFLAYQGIKSAIWHDGALQFSDQGAGLLRKDFYRPELGNEDFMGMLNRFWDNSVQYLASGFYDILGVRKANGVCNPFLAILIYLLAIVGLFFTYKKNKYIFFSGIVAGTFLVVTFFSIQAFWNQERLIIPVVPFVLLIIFAGFYYILFKKGFRPLQFLFVVLVALLTIAALKDTTKAVGEARKIKDEYSGLTPDWLHYMKASSWVGENLKKDEIAACRKATISTIYAKGKDFYPIYSVPVEELDPFLQNWNANQDAYRLAYVDHSLSNNLYAVILSEYVSRVEMGGRAFILINNNPNTMQVLTENKVPVIDYNQMLQMVEQVNNQVAIYSADSLLSKFRDSKVTHVLSANLRINVNVKNGATVNTVERYIYFIQEKYPRLFEQIYQEGRSDDEPATILKIRWEILDEK